MLAAYNLRFSQSKMKQRFSIPLHNFFEELHYSHKRRKDPGVNISDKTLFAQGPELKGVIVYAVVGV